MTLMKNGAENPLLQCSQKKFFKNAPAFRSNSTASSCVCQLSVIEHFSSLFPPNSMFDWVSQVVVVVKNPPAFAGDVRDTGLIPGSRRSPGGGRGNPLYSCLENPWERGAWRVTVLRVTESDTTEAT